jgi:hypothetical protein
MAHWATHIDESSGEMWGELQFARSFSSALWRTTFNGAPPIEFVMNVSEMTEGRRELNELDLAAAILYPMSFARVGARMIFAEPGIRPRVVDVPRGRPVSLQGIFNGQIDCGNS